MILLYVDPRASSMLIQTDPAAALAVRFLYRTQIDGVLGWFWIHSSNDEGKLRSDE